MKNLWIILLLIVGTQSPLLAQKTTRIWVVRHAEKDLSDVNDRDPDLSEEGKVRAEALMKALKGKKIDSIFSTNYMRTKLTGFPLADRIGISIKNYEPSQQKEWAKELLKNAAGKNILIIGHSNTVLELVEAFGAEKPVKELTEADYDYLFLVTVGEKKTQLKISHYGVSNRQTELP